MSSQSPPESPDAEQLDVDDCFAAQRPYAIDRSDTPVKCGFSYNPRFVNELTTAKDRNFKKSQKSPAVRQSLLRTLQDDSANKENLEDRRMDKRKITEQEERGQLSQKHSGQGAVYRKSKAKEQAWKERR